MPARDAFEPALFVVCGLPGVGKSTVAGYLTEAVGATRLRTDAIRKSMYETPQYTRSETDVVYRTLLDRAAESLDARRSVVLDATFQRKHHRNEAHRLAADLAVPFVLLKVEADPETVKRRIRSREGISDAGVEVYAEHRRQFDAIDLDHYVIDNSGSRSETHGRIDQVLRKERRDGDR